ncbi:MAG: phytanoyl-CoA dioxygenase family protein [Pseudomonadota bacterium]|nr:phytanoyl-CoA dioxygenase family protein [Pseudomonadota bacterium]
MPNFLTTPAVEQYHREGYLFPIRVVSQQTAEEVRDRLEGLENEMGGRFTGIHRTKFYLRHRWAYELATTPAMLDVVEDLIGPDILLYHNTTWLKNAGDEGYVTWHQDITYFGHEPPEVLSVWIALTHSTEESGCMRVLPGTHKEGPLPLTKPDLDDKNMLPSGQLVDFDTTSVMPVSMELKPGEASIHHACMIHGSLPNFSAKRRMGVTFCYHAADLAQRGKRRTSALLVRGKDQWGHYELEEPPKSDNDIQAISRHEHAVSLYRGKEEELGKKTVTRFD